MTRTTTAARGAKRKCDVLFSQLIRARGWCERCGSTANLQCAHIISRRYAHTRTDLENAYCLCAGCHMFFTDHPVEFARFVRGMTTTRTYERLRGQSQRRDKFDWTAELARLESLAAEARL